MKADSSFTHRFIAPTSITAAFDVAADPRTWWSEMITGSAREVGDTFTFHVPGLHYSQFEVTHAEPRRLVWEVIPSGEPTELAEWVGTRQVFEFTSVDDGTEVTFTHTGLTPQLECYAVCTTAWGYHLTAGLEALLCGRQPAPITPATIDHVARIVGARAATA